MTATAMTALGVGHPTQPCTQSDRHHEGQSNPSQASTLRFEQHDYLLVFGECLDDRDSADKNELQRDFFHEFQKKERTWRFLPARQIAPTAGASPSTTKLDN
jgi:hypothetical protein